MAAGTPPRHAPPARADGTRRRDRAVILCAHRADWRKHGARLGSRTGWRPHGSSRKRRGVGTGQMADLVQDMAATRTVAARAEGISRVFGEGQTAVRALDGVTAIFPSGQYTAVMGP